MTRGVRLALLVLLAAGGCKHGSSAPSVTLGPPRLLEPASGAVIADARQPVTLVIENVTTTGSAAPTYRFEVGTDDRFSTFAYSRDGVAQGSSGRTSLTIYRLPAARSYYWRAQARDGDATSAYSSPSRFDIGEATRLDPPVPYEPVDGATVSDQRPGLTVVNSARAGPVGTVTYTFEVADAEAFAAPIASGTVVEQTGRTTFVVPNDLPTDRPLYWRARASDGTTSSAWGTATFRVVAGIDLRQAVFVKGPNVHTWAETSRITSVRIGGGQICVEHTKLGEWPQVPFFDDPGTFAEGNFGFCANTKYMANGNGRDQWYCAAAFWNRPGQSCKSETAETLHDTWYLPSEEPMHSWVPRSGEPFGIYMTTPARFWPSMRTSDERTNVLLMRWPG